MKKTPITLSELIESVSVELRTIRANKPAEGEEVIALTNCEIELSVAATTEGSAGIKFYVIEFGGKGSATASHKTKPTFAVAGEKVFAIQRPMFSVVA
jgi:hypothetical protein